MPWRLVHWNCVFPFTCMCEAHWCESRCRKTLCCLTCHFRWCVPCNMSFLQAELKAGALTFQKLLMHKAEAEQIVKAANQSLAKAAKCENTGVGNDDDDKKPKKKQRKAIEPWTPRTFINMYAKTHNVLQHAMCLLFESIRWCATCDCLHMHCTNHVVIAVEHDDWGMAIHSCNLVDNLPEVCLWKAHENKHENVVMVWCFTDIGCALLCLSIHICCACE